MEKVGVFLSRMQPIHNAHLWMIKNALNENDKVLVLIGSANKKGTERNPFDIELRKRMVKAAIKEYFSEEDIERIVLKELVDWSTEQNNNDQEWGRLIYYNVVSTMNVKEFSYFCSEEPEKIEGWFEEQLRERINFRYFSRDNQFNGLSATKIRAAILDDNSEYIREYCPNCICAVRENLKEILKTIA